MKINKFILLVMILFLSIPKSNARDNDTLLMRNVIVEYDSKNLKYNISYDLEASFEKEYQVNLYLKYFKKDETKPFIVELKSVSGDIGTGNFAGKSRKIIWDQVKDYDLLKDMNEEAYQEFSVNAAVYSKQVKITNQELDETKNQYIISYDFDGATDIEYKVQLFFECTQNKVLSKKLKLVTGDVGIGYFAGKNRKIIWDWTKEIDLLKDFNDKLSDELELSFRVTIEPIIIKREKETIVAVESSGISKIYYWLGGAAVLGGGIVAYTLIKQPTSTTSTELPVPSGFGRPTP